MDRCCNVFTLITRASHAEALKRCRAGARCGSKLGLDEKAGKRQETSDLGFGLGMKICSSIYKPPFYSSSASQQSQVGEEKR